MLSDHHIKNPNQDEVKTGETIEVQYVYHRKSPAFVGTFIVPLNKMPDLPDFETTYKVIYDQERSKYIGREGVMKSTIPPLGNCKWNDAVFLSPLHPHYVYEGLKSAGFPAENIQSTHYFKIPITNLNLDPTVTTLWSHPATRDPIAPHTFSSLDAKTYRELDALPDETTTYFHQERQIGGRWPLLFRYVPHVMTTEPIKITNDVTVVDWQKPRF